MAKTQVIFYTVKNGALKIQVLLHKVDKHSGQKEKMKILVPDSKSLSFVENLLWGHPIESFRPHSINIPLFCQDLILVSLPLPAVDDFSIVFNLCQTAYIPALPVKIIYELEDVSDPQKAAVFRRKFQMYQKEGFTITSGT